MEAMKNAFAALFAVGIVAVMIGLQCMLAVVPLVIGLWLWKVLF